jgi:hypothetical protein
VTNVALYTALERPPFALSPVHESRDTYDISALLASLSQTNLHDSTDGSSHVSSQLLMYFHGYGTWKDVNEF